MLYHGMVREVLGNIFLHLSDAISKYADMNGTVSTGGHTTSRIYAKHIYLCLFLTVPNKRISDRDI